ncbi:MAG: HD-GYP domain-containing protein [Thermotogota bacterium]
MRVSLIKKHFDKSYLFDWGKKISNVKLLGGKHNLRVAETAYKLSIIMNLNKKYREKIYIGALVHDVGKSLIPKKILSKPTNLDPEEMRIIQKHSELGLKIVKTDDITVNNIILHHHERYDGSGYPYGLEGNTIPLEAQIVMISDIYDALRSDRPYKKIFSHEESMDIIKFGDKKITPSFYNPYILKIFLNIEKEIEYIYRDYDLSE